MKIKVSVKKPQNKGEIIDINTEFIKLDALLKFANVVMSGGEAKTCILDGLVRVNGEVCTQRGKKIYPGDVVLFEGNELIIRGGKEEI